MRVLVGCEFSGIVRDAFLEKGHDAYSCDLRPGNDRHRHIQADVLEIANESWDLGIFHPPCTFLTRTGLRWFHHPDDKHLPKAERRPHPKFPNRERDKQEAIEFFMKLWNLPIPRLAIENPRGTMSQTFRKPDHGVTQVVSQVFTSKGTGFSKWYWETSRGKNDRCSEV